MFRPAAKIWVCHACDNEGNRGASMLVDVQIQCEQCQHVRCNYCPCYPVGGYGESFLPRELVGDREMRRVVGMGDSGSEFSELESEVAGKETGRSKFVRTTAGAGKRVEESTEDFFRRGDKNRSMHTGESGKGGNDDIFAAPSNPASKGALARSLSAAASSPQQVGTEQTPSSAETSKGGVGSKGVEKDLAEDLATVAALQVRLNAKFAALAIAREAAEKSISGKVAEVSAAMERKMDDKLAVMAATAEGTENRKHEMFAAVGLIVSRAWHDSLLVAAAGAILTIAGLWCLLVTIAAASLVLCG